MTSTVVRNGDGRSVVHWFESPAEFAEAADRDVPPDARGGLKYWTGETWEEARRNAASGRVDRVAAAEALLEKVQSEVEAPRAEWVRARAGAFPVVPEALAGHPDSMRRKVAAQSSSAPLRVFVDLVSSGGISHKHLERRGVATLALVMALGAARPVELRVLVGMGGRGDRLLVAVRIPTAPLDLAAACNALTSAGFVRGLGYRYAYHHGSRGYDWAFGYYPEDDHLRRRYVRQVRAALGAAPEDLIVPPTFLTDPAAEDPVGFVRRGVAEHAGRDEDAGD